MSSEIEELIIPEKATISEIIEYIQILINKSKKLKLIANRENSVITTKATQSLVDLGYVKYDNIHTKTDIEDNKRNVKLIITLQKNKNLNMFNENTKNKNYIKGEIEIGKYLDQKIMYGFGEDCEIYINKIKVKREFTIYYKFPKEGTYSIIYAFNKILSSTHSMFYDCDKIKSLDFSNFNSQNITDTGFMFRGCKY